MTKKEKVMTAKTLIEQPLPDVLTDQEKAWLRDHHYQQPGGLLILHDHTENYEDDLKTARAIGEKIDIHLVTIKHTVNPKRL